MKVVLSVKKVLTEKQIVTFWLKLQLSNHKYNLPICGTTSGTMTSSAGTMSERNA